MGICDLPLVSYSLPCLAADAATDAASEAAGGVFDQFAEWVAEGAATAVRMAIAGWIDVGSPDVGSGSGGVAWLSTQVKPITYAVFALALMYQAGRLALSQRGEELQKILQSVLAFVLVAFGGAATVALLIEIGDAYSTSILDAATTGQAGADLGTRILVMLGLVTAAGSLTGSLGALGVVGVILGLVLAIASLIQIILIYTRYIILILMMGMLPVVAASAMTSKGRQILDRYVSWGLAWVLYKPTAASIYACGFFMSGSSDDITGFIIGTGAIVMALFALPSLMRVLNPLIGSMGAGAPTVGAIIATGAAMAGGRQSLSRLMGGGDGGGGGSDGGGGGDQKTGSVKVDDVTYGTSFGTDSDHSQQQEKVGTGTGTGTKEKAATGTGTGTGTEAGMEAGAEAGAAGTGVGAVITVAKKGAELTEDVVNTVSTVSNQATEGGDR